MNRQIVCSNLQGSRERLPICICRRIRIVIRTVPAKSRVLEHCLPLAAVREILRNLCRQDAVLLMIISTRMEIHNRPHVVVHRVIEPIYRYTKNRLRKRHYCRSVRPNDIAVVKARRYDSALGVEDGLSGGLE